MDYVGLVKLLFANGVNGDITAESNSLPAELPYSATSLVDHHITLQRGDAVSSYFDSSELIAITLNFHNCVVGSVPGWCESQHRRAEGSQHHGQT